MVRWVVGSILHGVDPLSYFSFQPVLHDWCNKGCGMCYPVCGMVHVKEPLLLISQTPRLTLSSVRIAPGGDGRPSVLLPASVCRGLRPPSAVRWGRAAVRVRRVGIELGPSLQPSRGLPQLCGVASARSSVSAGIQQPTQNWYGPGESDCLIKTKHCDGRHPVLTQCDFCPVL